MKAAAEASARYRLKQKAQGIPSSGGTDSLIAEAWVRSSANDTEKRRGWMLGARKMVFALMGWNKANKDLVEAVDERLMKLPARERDQDKQDKSNKPVVATALTEAQARTIAHNGPVKQGRR